MKVIEYLKNPTLGLSTKRETLLNKRGSYTIFITIIFVSMVFMLSVCFKVSGQIAIESAFKTFNKNWGRSILSEYDIELKDRYGIFGFNGNNVSIEDKIRFYTEYTTKNKKYLDYGESTVNLEDYSLINPNNFLSQVRNVMYYRTKPNIKLKDDYNGDNRYISAKWIINSLPSNASEYRVDSSLLDSVSIYDYLFIYFKDYVEKRNLGRTYFQNEIEYVITGKLDDEKAKDNVYYQILAIRNAINLAYLYSDYDKRAMVLALATILVPEAPEALEFALLEAWAYRESENDLLLLYDGKRVPAVKSEDTWNTSFFGAVYDLSKNYGVGRDVENGLNYEDYLKILLIKTSNQKKVLRIMDLIQINMKYNYNDSFLLSEYNIGLAYTQELNEKVYEFKEEY